MDGIRRIDEMSLFRARIPGLARLRCAGGSRGAAITLRSRRAGAPGPRGRPAVGGRRSRRAAHLSEFDATKILYHLAEAGYLESTSGPAIAPASPDDRLAAVCDGMNDVLRAITTSAAAHRAPSRSSPAHGLPHRPGIALRAALEARAPRAGRGRRQGGRAGEPLRAEGRRAPVGRALRRPGPIPPRRPARAALLLPVPGRGADAARRRRRAGRIGEAEVRRRSRRCR